MPEARERRETGDTRQEGEREIRERGDCDSCMSHSSPAGCNAREEAWGLEGGREGERERERESKRESKREREQEREREHDLWTEWRA